MDPGGAQAVEKGVHTVDDDRLVVQCGHCGARYRIEPRLEGRRAKCRRCRHIFHLTKKVDLDDSVIDWLEEGEDVVSSDKGQTTKSG